jgi:glycosyltransferase involved in cell wall biosynthesis
LKKVGVIVSRIDRGAAELLEVELAKSLIRLGYTVYLMPMYSPKFFNDSEVELKLMGEIQNIIRLNYDLKTRPILFFKNILYIRSLNFDCLISHNRGTDLLSFLLSVGKRTKRIKAFHAYFEKSSLTSCLNRIWSLVVKSADYSYHISQYALEQNINTFDLDKTKTSIVENVLDVKKIQESDAVNIRSVYKMSNRSKVILTVARVVPEKSIELGIEIVDPLLKRDPDLYYLIAGDTGLDIDYYNKLLNIVQENGLERQVLFIGFQKNIAGFMKESNVLLHFVKSEAFGLVLAESLHLGLPIVASGVGGISELLEQSPYKTFPLEALGHAREELRKYIYEYKREEGFLLSNSNIRSNDQRAKEVSLIIERICIA